MKSLIFLALAWTVKAQSGPDIPVGGPWIVENCIMANFTLDIKIHLNNSNPNETTTISIPPSAKVQDSSKCGTKEDKNIQNLDLKWIDVQTNDSRSLEREISISFRRNTTLGL